MRERERLSSRNERVIIPAICLVEISRLHSSGRIRLLRPLAQWFEMATSYPRVEVYPITPAIAVGAYTLPGDRLIVATARLLDAELLTDDGLIRRYEGVRTP